MGVSNKHGFITLELAIALTITMIALLFLTNLSIYQTYDVKVVKDELLTLLHHARTNALVKDDRVVVCALINNKCANTWDTNTIGALNGNNVFAKINIHRSDYISWKSSLANTQKIIFRRDGSTQNEQGTLRIGCKNNLPCYKIVINYNGSIHYSL